MRALADTQVLIWYVIDPGRLSAPAAAVLQQAVDEQEPLGVSAFALVEIAYAVEKASNPLTAADRDAILAVLRDPETPFDVLALDLAVAEQVARVPRTANADPGDRIVVATAEVHGLGIVSSDRKLPGMTQVDVIW